MKITKTILISVILLISQLAIGQNRIWNSPICNRFSTSSGLTIKNIQFYSNATIIEFLYDNNFGQAGWVQLRQDCEIIAYPSKKTYKLTAAEGIPYAPSKHNFSSANETLSFRCIFPAVPNGTTSIDWVEEGNWVITGIRSQTGIPVDNSNGIRYVCERWIMPEYSTLSDNKGLELTDVELTNNQTVLWFRYTNYYDNGWASIEKDCKIVAYPSARSLTMIKSTGLPVSPAHHEFKRRGEQLRFSLTFPALPQGTTKFNFIESSNSTWKFFDIRPSSAPVSFSEHQGHSGSSYGQGQADNNEFFDANISQTYLAYASCSCYVQNDGNWSDFSEWQQCNIQINYNKQNQTITFHLAAGETIFKILGYESPDPAIKTVRCEDTRYSESCNIEFVTLPNNGGYQIYLDFGDERICYAIESEETNTKNRYALLTKPEQNDNWSRYAQDGAIENYNRGYELQNDGDYRAAFDLFRRSSEGGCELATVKLAYMYMSGVGVQQNIELALAYIDRAIENFKTRNLIYPLGDGYWYANALNAKGEICATIGDWDEAMEIFLALIDMGCDNMDDTPFFKAMQEKLRVR